MVELNEEQIKFKSEIRKRRRSKLDELMMSEQGRQAITEMIMFIASRASIVSSAARIGINPNTLSRWLGKGKKDSVEGRDTNYAELWDRVVIAIGQATAECEVELHQMKPETYLKYGPGRILMGDSYNTTNLPGATFNLDGTISDTTISTSITEESNEPIAIEIAERNDEADNNVMLEALKAMRDNGIDVNSVVDDLIAKQTKTISKEISGDDHDIVGEVSTPCTDE